jgi:hypothetical protein
MFDLLIGNHTNFENQTISYKQFVDGFCKKEIFKVNFKNFKKDSKNVSTNIERWCKFGYIIKILHRHFLKDQVREIKSENFLKSLKLLVYDSKEKIMIDFFKPIVNKDSKNREPKKSIKENVQPIKETVQNQIADDIFREKTINNPEVIVNQENFPELGLMNFWPKLSIVQRSKLVQIMEIMCVDFL